MHISRVNITNVRMGFAINSSSTHSIILNPIITPFAPEEDWQYGWEDFLIVSPQDKMKYMATTLCSNLSYVVPDEWVVPIVSSLLKMDIPDERYVDHQSLICLPTEFRHWPCAVPNMEFFNDLTKYIVNNGVAIAGGNDNQEDDEKVDYGGTQDPKLINLPIDNRFGDLVACKDGEYWILFNRRSGTKIRLSFTTDKPYEYASKPELVDLKITSYCPQNCKFCYTDSKITGTHAPWRDAINALSTLEVFEVVLGGGDPTTHSNFADILEEIYHCSMIPSFATRNTHWLEIPSITEAVKKYCPGFAVSIESSNIDMLNTFSAWKTLHKYLGQISVQHVLGVDDTNTVCYFLEKVKALGFQRITFLGFKAKGRGKTFKPQNIDIKQILDKCKELHLNVGMDTSAVNQHYDVLKTLDVPDVLMQRGEGVFSMFIDLVEGYIAPSSFSDHTIQYKNLLKDIQTYFPWKE